MTQSSSESLDEASLPGLVDVQIPESQLYRLRPVPIIVGAILVNLTPFALWPTFNLFIWGFASLAPVVVVAYILFQTWRRHVHRKISQIISLGEGRPIPELVQQVFGSRGRATLLTHLEGMVLGLAAHGRVGATIRNCPPKFAAPIDPITVRFEPRPLDEADDSIITLEEALDSTTDDATTKGALSSPGQADNPLTRRVKRNLLLGGGWVVLFAFGILTVAHGWRSYRSGHVWWQFAMFFTFLALLLIGNQMWSALGHMPWLLVPGGVIIRKARLLRRESRVQLFDRRTSLLLLHRASNRHWIAFVADGESLHPTIVTPHEVTLLLRAWLSPLTPPSVERLSDLI